MAWKHSKENKEARTQKDVSDYLKRETGKEESIMKKQYEDKMTRRAIADSNKQHKRGSINYISSKKKEVASKMGKVTPSRIEAMERAYKDKGRSVPLRYHVAAKKQIEDKKMRVNYAKRENLGKGKDWWK